MVSKINESKLAPDMIGGIIQHIEETPIKNLDNIYVTKIKKVLK